MFVPNWVQQKDEKMFRKRDQQKDVELEWYFYSRITNNSADHVLLRKNGQEKEICKADWCIVNVGFHSDTLLIRTISPTKGLVDTTYKVIQATTDSSVFGFRIIFDTTAEDREITTLPPGRRAFW